MEMLVGHSVTHEYREAARDRFVSLGENPFSAEADEKIVNMHIGSPEKIANLYKVKSRMIITRDFIHQHIGRDLKGLSFLDVGGSSEFFFDLLGIDKDKGSC